MTDAAELTEDPADPAQGPVRTLLQGQDVADFGPVTPMARRGNVRRITEIGEDVLHRRCRSITDFGTDGLAALIDDMFTTMLVAEGVGLAANQIGVDAQLFVYDLTDADGVRHVGHLINPAIEAISPDETEEMTEGCLSVPGPGADLYRPYHVRVRGVDQHGEPLTHEATGYLARCFLHETGHLHGQLYTDLLAKRVRKRVLAEMADLREKVFTRRTEVALLLDKEPARYPERSALEDGR
ncbi:peptide deformylase [Pseudactinotalea sp. Z1739]|uniref:peptide deformylase n=1 Tax=Pseudactinotalea sp. Z1739 TaxID=3413028 RepID=UPI003C7D839C